MNDDQRLNRVSIVHSTKFIRIGQAGRRPNITYPLTAAVMVYNEGRQDSGNDDMIIVLNRDSESVEPIWVKLSRRCTMSWK